jgi:hypothetical protein
MCACGPALSTGDPSLLQMGQLVPGEGPHAAEVSTCWTTGRRRVVRSSGWSVAERAAAVSAGCGCVGELVVQSFVCGGRHVGRTNRFVRAVVPTSSHEAVIVARLRVLDSCGLVVCGGRRLALVVRPTSNFVTTSTKERRSHELLQLAHMFQCRRSAPSWSPHIHS